MCGVVSAADLSAGSAAGWLVVGWFTPDYRHWATRLAASLDRVGAPYHLLACEKNTGHWEAETMRKARIVRRLRESHPGKTLILLDVDCEVRRSLEPLVASVNGDVAAFVRAKTTGRGKDRARIKVMTGTMVFRPTAGAQSFIDAWEQAQAECDSTDVDQTALMIALGRATNFTFQPLGAEWCALDATCHPDPAILHDNASRDVRRGRAQLPREVLLGFVNRVRGMVARPYFAARPAPVSGRAVASLTGASSAGDRVAHAPARPSAPREPTPPLSLG